MLLVESVVIYFAAASSIRSLQPFSHLALDALLEVNDGVVTVADDGRVHVGSECRLEEALRGLVVPDPVVLDLVGPRRRGEGDGLPLPLLRLGDNLDGAEGAVLVLDLLEVDDLLLLRPDDLYLGTVGLAAFPGALGNYFPVDEGAAALCCYWWMDG